MLPFRQSHHEKLQEPLEKDQRLLDAIKACLPELEQARTLFAIIYEDGLYRFYHGSFKVYSLQDAALKVIEIFRNIAHATNNKLCGRFEELVVAGTGQEFELEHNASWPQHARPIVEAFLHTKYFLEMMIKYGNEMESVQAELPDGWAAILELYNQR